MSRLELSTPTKAQARVEVCTKTWNAVSNPALPDCARLTYPAHFWIFVMHRPVENAFLAASDWDN